MPRLPGVKSEMAPPVVEIQPPSRCPNCGSARRGDYYGRRVERSIGQAPDGHTYWFIVRRRCRCLDCGQVRIDKQYRNPICPSDLVPKTIGERIRRKRLQPLIKAWQSFKLPASGPHYNAALDFLEQFNGGPHERELWKVLRHWTRPTEAEWRDIGELAAREKLDPLEYLYRDALPELRRYVKAHGISAKSPEDGSDADTARARQPEPDGNQAARPGLWSRPMALTELADRVFKNPRKTRKLMSLYSKRLRRIGRQSWEFRFDGLPENIQLDVQKA